MLEELGLFLFEPMYAMVKRPEQTGEERFGLAVESLRVLLDG
jgi:hypothetical protein